MSVILVDMDDVIASWNAEYDALLDAAGESALSIPRKDERRDWDLHAGRTVGERDIIREIMAHPGFYSRLAPIAGARSALRAMVKAGHDVRIVSAPFISNPTCASDKLNWVAKRYGRHWAARVVLTNDKTIVRGDYLIDDKPAVTGSQEPSWEHIWFTQPVNAHLTGRRRLNHWNEWESILV